MAKPDQGTISVLSQLCKMIPPFLVSKVAREHGCDKLSHLHSGHPGFGPDRRYGKYPSRFRCIINAIDSTTIQLVANCMA